MYKIILVDDEDSVLEGLQKIIHWESYGFEIAATANDGVECLRIFHDVQPDLIISDIKMRELDGLKMIETIRQWICNQPKVIFLSGYNDFQFAKQALAVHAYDYILKPLVEEELIKAITQVKDSLDKDKVIEKVLHQVKKQDAQTYLLDFIYDNSEETKIQFVEAFDVKEEQQFQVGMVRINAYELIQDSISKHYKEIQNQIGYILDDSLIKCGMYEIDKQHIGIFIAFNEDEEGKEFVQKFSYQLHNEVEKIININIQIAFGDSVDSLEKISESYNHALYALPFHVYYENKNLIRYDEIKQCELSPLNKKDLMEDKELLDAIMENDYEKIYSFFTYNFMRIKSKKIIFQDIVDYVNRVFLYIMEELGKEKIETTYPDRARLLGIQKSRASLSIIQKELLNFSIWASDLLKSQTKSSKIIKDIMQYINDNYREDITLKSIAEHFYLNPVYLGQIFQKNTEIGFKKYLEKLRLEESKRLLNTTQKTVYEIAYEVGYNNPEYYSRVFQKYYGKTPSQYRNAKK